MIDVNGTVQELAHKLGITSPQTLELLTRVTVRSTMLASRAIAGEDVEKEQWQVRAQLSNLNELVRRTTSDLILEKITTGLATVLTKAIVG